MTMQPLKAHVKNGRLVLDEPTDLPKGEEIELYKRQKMIARLLPVGPKTGPYPDFSVLRRRIFGTRKSRKTGTDLVSEERGAY